MLDQDFCNFLEYQLTKAFRSSNNEIVRRFWCDGLALPLNRNDYSSKSVNDKRKVEAIAYTGMTGQDKYNLVLQFGQKALGRYLKDLDITECVPGPEADNWYIVDLEKRIITIQLL